MTNADPQCQAGEFGQVMRGHLAVFGSLKHVGIDNNNKTSIALKSLKTRSRNRIITESLIIFKCRLNIVPNRCVSADVLLLLNRVVLLETIR